MPRYTFVCHERHESVIRLSFEQYDELVKDDPKLVCNTCFKPVKQKIGVVGILFKGDGFTTTGRV